MQLVLWPWSDMDSCDSLEFGANNFSAEFCSEEVHFISEKKHVWRAQLLFGQSPSLHYSISTLRNILLVFFSELPLSCNEYRHSSNKKKRREKSKCLLNIKNYNEPERTQHTVKGGNISRRFIISRVIVGLWVSHSVCQDACPPKVE